MKRAGKAVLISLGLLAIGLEVTLAASSVRAQQAEVTLRLVDPANPGLLIVNDTGTEAEGIDYKIALWNADNMESGYKLLPIPSSGFRNLEPRSTLGPIDLFDAREVRAWLKPGNRIVGNVGVKCQNCARGHTYWVLITWDEGGWFAELKDRTNGAVIAPQPWLEGNLRDHELQVTLLSWTTDIAQADRVQIAPFAPSDRTLKPSDDAPAR